jgi:hypothetical protein
MLTERHSMTPTPGHLDRGAPDRVDPSTDGALA